MAPALLGVSVAQISLVINTQIASHVGVGAVSWLTFADRLMEFPTALLGVASASCCCLSCRPRWRATMSVAMRRLLDWGLRLVVLLALPCAAALLVFAEPLVAVLYHYGAFTARDVAQTELAVQGYGVGLIGLVAVKVLAPGFYARQNIRTPVKIAVGVLLATQAMNVVLVPWLGHAGLALSIGLGAMANAALLFIGLRRSGAYTPLPGWAGFVIRVAFATAALTAALAWAAASIDWIGLSSQWGWRVGLMAVVLAGVALLYFGLLALVGLRPRQFMSRG